MIEHTNQILDLIVLGLIQMQEQDEIHNDFFKLGMDKLANYYFNNDKIIKMHMLMKLKI